MVNTKKLSPSDLLATQFLEQAQHFIANENLGDLYAAEKNLKELRYEIGL